MYLRRNKKKCKDSFKIQDGGQKKDMRGNLKFDLHIESYRSILAITHFYDAL